MREPTGRCGVELKLALIDMSNVEVSSEHPLSEGRPAVPQMTVGTTVVLVDGYDSLFFNVGPGTLYVGATDVTVETGLPVAPGGSTKLHGVGKVGLISDSSCDVRQQVAGEFVSGAAGGGSSSTAATDASAPTALTVGTAAMQLLAVREGRRGFIVQNLHDANDLYIGLGVAPTAANGIRVKPGESFNDDFFTGAVHGIASAAGTDVRVVEVF